MFVLKGLFSKVTESLAEYKISLLIYIFGKNDISIHSDRIFPALHEFIIQLCQRALNSEPRTKSYIITPCTVRDKKINESIMKLENRLIHISLFSSFMPKKCTFFKQRHKPYQKLRKFSIHKVSSL
jgi:hypothetical protein